MADRAKRLVLCERNELWLILSVVSRKLVALPRLWERDTSQSRVSLSRDPIRSDAFCLCHTVVWCTGMTLSQTGFVFDMPYSMYTKREVSIQR